MTFSPARPVRLAIAFTVAGWAALATPALAFDLPTPSPTPGSALTTVTTVTAAPGETLAPSPAPTGDATPAPAPTSTATEAASAVPTAEATPVVTTIDAVPASAVEEPPAVVASGETGRSRQTDATIGLSISAALILLAVAGKAATRRPGA